MKILTWDTLNYGDRLNDFVWKHYLPQHLNDADSDLLVGIGSLLNHRLPTTPTKWILGSGVGHGGIPRVDETWRIIWLRGPLSAGALGVSPKLAITDGGILLADLVESSQTKSIPVSFMPHCSALVPGAIDTLEKVCHRLGIHLINPESPVEQVIDDIRMSRRLITEALHGAITADTLRVPWHPVARSGIHGFKWADWSSSLEFAHRPTLLPYRAQWFSTVRHPRISRRVTFPFMRPVSKTLLQHQLKRIAGGQDWRLSEGQIIIHRIDAMKRAMQAL